MDTVEQEHQELLCILLLVPREIHKPIPEHSLEGSRINIASVLRAEPQPLEDIPQRAGNLPVRTMHVAVRQIDLLQVPIPQKILGELGDLTQALQCRIHVAGVPQIGQPNPSIALSVAQAVLLHVEAHQDLLLALLLLGRVGLQFLVVYFYVFELCLWLVEPAWLHNQVLFVTGLLFELAGP